MTTKEFSDSFDTLLNSYQNSPNFGETERSSNITIDEYEKSVFLTRAQEEIVVSFYSGKNANYESFESSEELRRYLDSLVKTKVYQYEEQLEGLSGLSDNSIFFKLPKDMLFISLEEVIYDTDDCYNNTYGNVYPITHDEWANVKDNPFRGPTKYKAIRLDYGDNIVEIISKLNFKNYIIKYLSKPNPIILVDLPDGLSIQEENKQTECSINSILHNTILQRAVELAIASKSRQG